MMQSEAWEVMGDLMRTAFGTPGYRLLQPPFNFFPALSLAANVDFGRPKGRSTMMGSPHFLAKVVVTGYRQL